MSIGDFPESLSQAMLVGCNVSRRIGRKLISRVCLKPRSLEAGSIAPSPPASSPSGSGATPEPVGRPVCSTNTDTNTNTNTNSNSSGIIINSLTLLV